MKYSLAILSLLASATTFAQADRPPRGRSDRDLQRDAGKLKPVPIKDLQEEFTGKIVGGEDVDPPFKYPFMVRGGGCGASLVAPNILLCAAHCINAFSTVQIGRHDINDSSEDYEEFGVLEKIPHPDYNTGTLDYDFMMVRLDGVSTYEPIELDATDGTSPGSPVTVTGWGTTSSGGPISPILQEVEVIVKTNAACNADYDGEITDQMVCAAAPGKDSCQGDSGGPLFDYSSGSAVQIGVVSWGIGCAEPDYPGVYARVSSVIEWIQGIMDDWSLDPTVSPAPTPAPTPFDCDKAVFKIEITADNFPFETSWELNDICNNVVIDNQANLFDGPGGYYEKQICIDEEGRYEATIMDSYGDGICCSEGDGGYKFLLDGEVMKEGGEFDYVDRHQWGSCPPLICDDDEILFKVEINADSYDDETSWGLYDMCDDMELEYEDDLFNGSYGYYEKQVCVDGAGQYNATIFDTYGDGICCSVGEGSYKFLLDGEVVKEGGEFDYSDSYEWGTCDGPPPPECEDSPLKFKFEKEDDTTTKFTKCKDMEISWCDIGKNSRSCPKTCGTCDKCKDSKNKFKTNDWNGKTKKKKCKDVNNEKKCGWEGIAETCRDTCSEWVDGLC